MQVRTFESKDMATGLQMIKKELGPDALILSTKTIRDKSAGILGKRLFEITAAIDGDPPKLHSVSEKTVEPAKKVQTIKPEQLTFRHVVDDSLDEYLTLPPPEKKSAEAPLFRFSDLGETRPYPASLENEVNELKELVKNLAQQLNRVTDDSSLHGLNVQPQTQSGGCKATQRCISSQNHGGDQVLSNLVQRGIKIDTARTISENVREILTDQQLNDSNRVHSTIVDIIQNLMGIVSPKAATASTQQQRIAFVGPTGVGKTTTLAKIAAAHLMNRSKSIALITIDTYRIAAVEQLKVYGDIMHLPVDIVITPDQLVQALNKHSDKDLILIDTAGRSPKDKLCIDELASFLKTELEIERHLVLSATTREDELMNTIKQFGSLDITNTIFTKIDECMNLGILLNIQLQNPAPLSYLTNGQKVPEDLLHISPGLVAKLIMTQPEGSLND